MRISIAARIRYRPEDPCEEDQGWNARQKSWPQHYRGHVSSSQSSSSLLLLLLFVLVLCCCTTTTLSQRVKEGCWDAAPLSCDSVPTTTAAELLQQTGINAEATCAQLALAVFPSQDILMDPSLHADYINGIDAESEFCTQVHASYAHCLFCDPDGLDDGGLIQDCIVNSIWTNCGSTTTMSMAELLADSSTPATAAFSTPQDVQRVCLDLQASYNATPWLVDLNVAIPSTIDLCQQQLVVQHQCPGYCDGDCFDNKEYLECNSTYKSSFVATPDVDVAKVCDTLDFFDFYWLNRANGVNAGSVIDTSHHAEHLRNIHNGTKSCEEARVAYPQCQWCATEKCFTEQRPPTCAAPDQRENPLYNAENLTANDVGEICNILYTSLQDVEGTPNFYNVSQHTALLAYGANTTFCEKAHAVYDKCMWCEPDPVPHFCDYNSWCTSTATLPEDFVLDPSVALFNLSAPQSLDNCTAVQQAWSGRNYTRYPTVESCYTDIWINRQCAQVMCDTDKLVNLNPNYLGATNDAQKAALVWMSRTSAILSFLGASYILFDILSNRRSRATVYYQLIVGMATFDIVTAVSWGFASAPINPDDAWQVYGAMGTDATCKAQAFFVQLGFTSIFYNVSLALYYVLVIAKDWREFHLKKIQVYMHALPLLLGLGLAFGGLPVYHWMEYGCHLLPPPEGKMWQVLVFVVIPLGFSIVSITVSMVVVYCEVHQKALASEKWSHQGVGGGITLAKQLEKDVFWQCLFYVCAFYVSWPILFAVYLASIDVNGPLGLTLIVAFLVPLQGFSNFLVFIRPKVNRCLRRRAKNAAAISHQPTDSTSPRRSRKASFFGRLIFLRSSIVFTKSELESPNNVPGFEANTDSDVMSEFHDEVYEDMDPSARIALRSDVQAELPIAPTDDLQVILEEDFDEIQ